MGYVQVISSKCNVYKSTSIPNWISDFFYSFPVASASLAAGYMCTYLYLLHCPSEKTVCLSKPVSHCLLFWIVADLFLVKNFVLPLGSILKKRTFKSIKIVGKDGSSKTWSNLQNIYFSFKYLASAHPCNLLFFCISLTVLALQHFVVSRVWNFLGIPWIVSMALTSQIRHEIFLFCFFWKRANILSDTLTFIKID